MRKAFIVGINTYQDSPLNGCVNDGLLIYKVLSEKYDFNTKDIDIITDREATKNNIIKGLKKLTTGLTKDDYIFFHYSGHGSQVVSKDWTKTDEADGRDEIICPVDMNWDDPLRDNDLNEFFANISCKALVILDSCHSGTGLRSGCNWKSRFLPPPISNMLSNPMISLDDNLDFVYPIITKDVQTQKRGFLVDTAKQGNTILISGCRENQTSADAYFGNKYHGALTYTLVMNLRNAKYKISYNNLINNINRDLRKLGFQQEPQLEGKANKFKELFLA